MNLIPPIGSHWKPAFLFWLNHLRSSCDWLLTLRGLVVSLGIHIPWLALTHWPLYQSAKFVTNRPQISGVYSNKVLFFLTFMALEGPLQPCFVSSSLLLTLLGCAGLFRGRTVYQWTFTMLSEILLAREGHRACSLIFHWPKQVTWWSLIICPGWEYDPCKGGTYMVRHWIYPNTWSVAASLFSFLIIRLSPFLAAITLSELTVKHSNVLLQLLQTCQPLLPVCYLGQCFLTVFASQHT